MTQTRQRFARDIRNGDAVDLESAPHLTPEFIESHGLEYEFAIVVGTEMERRDCIRIDFEGVPSIGFHPDDVLTIRAGAVA